MPIDYSKYPTNWKTEIRPSILNRANNCCEFCGVTNYDYGFRDKAGIFYNDNFIIQQLELYGNDMFDDKLSTSKRIRIILTIAHLDHDVNNNDFSNLKALCQRCHNRYDVGFRKENRKTNKGVLSLF